MVSVNSMPPESEVNQPLDEVMLAMDVVDTLRYQKVLVDRELNSERRKQNLIERLRELYASQGIEVTDSVLAEGVKALEEDRFRYRPTEEGFKHTLANIYIERGKWGRRLGVLLLALLLIRGGYYLFVEAPENRENRQQLTELNEAIDARLSQVRTLSERAKQLENQLDAEPAAVAAEFVAARDRFHKHASQTLDKTRVVLDSVKGPDLSPDIDRDNIHNQADTINQQLADHNLQLTEVEADLDTVQADIESISVYAVLPDSLKVERDSASQIAKIEKAKKQAEQLYADPIAG